MGSFDSLYPYGSSFLWNSAEFLPAPTDFSGSFTSLGAAVQNLITAVGSFGGGTFCGKVQALWYGGTFYQLSCSFYYADFNKNTFQQMGSFETLDAYARAPKAEEAQTAESVGNGTAEDAVNNALAAAIAAAPNAVVWDVVVVEKPGPSWDAAVIYYTHPGRMFAPNETPKSTERQFQSNTAHAYAPKARGLRAVSASAGNPSAAISAALSAAGPDAIIYRHGMTYQGGTFTSWIAYATQATNMIV